MKTFVTESREYVIGKGLPIEWSFRVTLTANMQAVTRCMHSELFEVGVLAVFAEVDGVDGLGEKIEMAQVEYCVDPGCDGGGLAEIWVELWKVIDPIVTSCNLSTQTEQIEAWEAWAVAEVEALKDTAGETAVRDADV